MNVYLHMLLLNFAKNMMKHVIVFQIVFLVSFFLKDQITSFVGMGLYKKKVDDM